jgi:hypothetical protein
MRAFFLAIVCAATAAAQGLPVRGLHLSAPRPDDLPQTLKFIREALPKEGVNTLILEFGLRYQWTRRPELIDDGALSREQMNQIAAACRQSNVRLIPLINLLGHQSWAKNTGLLLRKYPEFDETPGKYPGNEGIYCRSYCPLHPKVHEVVFDLVDEIVEVTGADAFHAGMDEVFLLGEDDCERCRGKNKAELFAGEVRLIHDHLARNNKQLWIWGDRLLDGAATGIGKWEASLNDTAPAITKIPTSVVISDWHYEAAHPTAAFFALHGFQVVSAPWRKTSVALRQLELVETVRRNAAPPVAARMLGMLQTTWVPLAQFLKAYYGEEGARPQAMEAAQCFKELFRELRKPR